MDVEIIAVGGYDEVGRNMTAVRCGKEIVVFDMGLRLDQVMIHEDAEIENMHSLDLIQIKAIPDDTMMNAIEGQVKAIVCTHGHLDHIGAIPKLAHRYNAPIISTPYTTELIRQQIQGENKFEVKNKSLRAQGGREVHDLPQPRARVRADAALDHRHRCGRPLDTARGRGLRLRLQDRPDPRDRRAPGPRAPGPDRQGGRPRPGRRGHQHRPEGAMSVRADRARPRPRHHDELRGREVRDHRLDLRVAHLAHQDDRRDRARDGQKARAAGPLDGALLHHGRADEARQLPAVDLGLRQPPDGRADHAADHEDRDRAVRPDRNGQPGRARRGPDPDLRGRDTRTRSARGTRSSSRPT